TDTGVRAGGPNNSGILAVGPRSGGYVQLSSGAARDDGQGGAHRRHLRAAPGTVEGGGAPVHPGPPGDRFGDSGGTVGRGGRGECADGGAGDPGRAVGGVEESGVDSCGGADAWRVTSGRSA